MNQSSLPTLPSIPPSTPIPPSVVLYEALKLVPHIVAEVGVLILMATGKLTPDTGLVALLAIIAGQLYPRRAPSPIGGG